MSAWLTVSCSWLRRARGSGWSVRSHTPCDQPGSRPVGRPREPERVQVGDELELVAGQRTVDGSTEQVPGGAGLHVDEPLASELEPPRIAVTVEVERAGGTDVAATTALTAAERGRQTRSLPSAGGPPETTRLRSMRLSGNRS